MSKYFEDIVLSIAVVLGMLIGLYLSYALVVQGAQYPPTLISTFIGVALAALIYRFMGGLGGTEFGAGMLKLGGAAAFIVGFIWFVGDRLKDEVQLYSSTETYRSQIEALEKQRDNAQAVSDKQGEEIEKLRKTQLNAPNARGVYTISEIKQMKPDNPFIQSLKRLVEGQEGPFSPTLRELVVRVSVVAGPNSGPTFYICPDTLEKLNEGVDAPSTEIQISRTLDDGTAASLVAKRGGKIGQDVCTNEQRDFDVQINCAAALPLFADKMASCSEGATVRGSKVTIGSLAA